MKIKATITVKNKIYPYTLEKIQGGTVRVVSKDAKINQEFLAEDVSEIILDLPNLIIAEQQYEKKQSNVIRFRISSEDKNKIEKKAIGKGYSSVSGYLRDLALK
jgi:DNA-directed RNA polymerase subunit E'/Rpb7